MLALKNCKYENPESVIVEEQQKTMRAMNDLTFILKVDLLISKSLFVYQWGEDTCEINILVAGKPAAPGGPLSVTEVSKRGCLLAWKPPADNGGYQISHYEVEKMDMSMGSWLPVKSVNR